MYVKNQYILPLPKKRRGRKTTAFRLALLVAGLASILAGVGFPKGRIHASVASTRFDSPCIGATIGESTAFRPSSSQASIPEPASIWILAVGATLLLGRRRTWKCG
jgi:hypothetical protein